MDSIHDPDSRLWVSEKIQLSSYFDEYMKLANDYKPKNDMSTVSNDNIRKMIGLEDQNTGDPEADKAENDAKKVKFDNLLDVMDIKHLDIPGDLPPMQVKNPVGETHGPDVPKFEAQDIPEEGTNNLKSCFMQKWWLEKTKDKRKYKQRRMRQSRDDNDFMFCAEKPPEKIMNPQFTMKNVLYCVRVYRPFKHFQARQAGRTANVTIKYSQEIWLLGDNTLEDLRDMIKCTANLHIVGDRQADGLKTPVVRAEDEYKSGFIYVEGCFYNDMRDANNIDYSKVIRDWAEDSPRGIGPFTTGSMSVRLEDLDVRVGMPYVYVHQGEHEHLISFVDIRLIGKDDPQRPSDYPLVRSLGAQQSKYCMVCETYIAKWATKNHSRVTEDPYFWCGSCFKLFNYKNKEKIGKFDAFQFFDVNII